MNALVSGRSGVALIRHQERLMSVHVDNPGQLVPRTTAEWTFLLEHARDLMIIEDTALDEIIRALHDAYRRTIALDLTLTLLDPELSAQVRHQAADELELLIQEPSCLAGLQFVLFATPAPAAADLSGAVRFASETPLIRLLLNELSTHQDSIRAVTAAWRTVVSNFSQDIDADDWDRVRQCAVQAGLFFAMSTGRDDAYVQEAYRSANRMPALREIPGTDRILSQWTALSTRTLRNEAEANQSAGIVMSAASWASRDIAIDFGTSNVQAYATGRGIVINEPAIAALDLATNTVAAVGRDALEVLKDSHLTKVRPMISAGAQPVTILDETFELFARKALSGDTRPPKRLIVSVPRSTLPVHVNALRTAASRTLASKVHIVDATVAAAVGAGFFMSPSPGQMLVDIGGESTEITVMSPAGIVYSQRLRVAGDAFDEAIILHMKQRYQVLIGERTAEQIKIELGSALPLRQALAMEIKGRALIEATPRTIVITDREIHEALAEPVSTIVEGVVQTLERLPPELRLPVTERGIVLSGGGAMLRGLAARLEQEVHVRTSVTSEPMSTSVVGTGRMLDDLNLLQRVERFVTL